MRRRSSSLVVLALVVGAYLTMCSIAPAAAQSATGTIDGTIVDQTGAAMPGVTITAVQTATRIP